MNKTQKTLWLLKLVKAVRAFANGILIVTFFQHLFMKDVEEYALALVQICAFFGTIFASYIVDAYQQKLGTKTTMVIASLVMLLTAISFSEIKALSLLLLTGVTGIMPTLGHQIELFSNIQKSYIKKQTLKQFQVKSQSLQAKQKAISNYQLIGTVFKALGSLFCMFVYAQNEQNSAQTDEKSHVYLTRTYSVVCGLHLLVYLFVDAEELQQIGLDKNGQAIRQEPRYNVRVRLFFFVTVILFLGIEITNLTTFSFFVYQKYELPSKSVAQLIAGIIILTLIGKKIAKKLIVDCDFLKASLIITMPISLLLIYSAIAQSFLTIHIVIFLLNYVGNEIIVAAFQKGKAKFLTNEEIQQNQSLIKRFKYLGIFCFFFTVGTATILYSVPLIIAGVCKALAALFISLMLKCLGSHSYSIQNEDYPHRPENQPKLQQNERLHVPGS